MKREFAILKSRTRLTIRLTRDSVAAADDAFAPHEKDVQTYSFLDPSALLNEIAPTYLPAVMGYGHSWDCILNGRLIATITVNGVQPHVRDVEYADQNHLHFTYKSAPY